MTTSSSDIIANLESKVDFFDRAVVIAVAFSVLFSALLLIYRARLNSEQKKEIAELQAKTAIAIDNSEQARSQAANATKGLADAQAEAERERIKRLLLQKAIAPREIDIDALANELKPFSGYSVVAEWYEDIEVKLLIEQFKAAFSKAGITYNRGGRGPMMMVYPIDNWVGIRIFGEDSWNEDQNPLAMLAYKIRSHLISHGIEAEFYKFKPEEGEASSLPPKTLKMRIGVKPVPNIHGK